MNVLNHFLKISSVAAVLLLGACATPPGPAPVSGSTSGDSGLVLQSSRELKGPGPTQPQAVTRNTGPLSPIDTLALPSRSVVSLAPPTDLWERIRRSYAMPDLESDLVHDREQWYSSRPDYIFRMTERSKKYLFHVVEELELRNMPTELALLPFIESAFNPQAVSSAKAAGMWQFMPATGKYFELKQNAFRDDRRDVLASTRAALDYLQKLYGMFGDWHLALAAYNWGEGSVGRAIAKNKRAGLPTGYSDINMPMETRMYVPKLQAVKNIVTNPARYSSTLPLIENHPYFQSVDIRRDMDLDLAAKLAEVDLADFKALNPSLNRPVILAAGTPQILLPWDNAAIFQTNLDAYGGARLASWSAWVAPTTMRPADAAKRVGMSEAELRSVNKIPPRVVIRAGSTLLVPRKDHMGDVTEKVADNGQLTLAPEVTQRRTTVRAGKRDTVASVAKKYRVSPNALAEWNNVSAGATFKSGQQVVLYLPQKARTKKVASSKRSSGSKSSKSSSRSKVAK
jgi:membrane-bound lytic murein transglycosylase D